MSDEPRYCHKCEAWHSPTDAGWQAGCQSELSPAHGSARSSAEAILRLWWLKMPEWAKHAYHQDPAMHRVIIECSMQETTEAEMLWRMIEALYEQRNQWRDTALHLKQYEPLVVIVPNEKVS